jgi:hypothetical protein
LDNLSFVREISQIGNVSHRDTLPHANGARNPKMLQMKWKWKIAQKQQKTSALVTYFGPEFIWVASKGNFSDKA